MLRVIESDNPDQAKGYYTQGLSKEDYYAQGQETPGKWQGKGAERLGLGGEVQKAAFEALCENRDPRTGKPLTPRTKAKRRVGYDINFHCPKSVSVLHAMTHDEGIMEAFQTAVRETMAEMEAEMQTRVRKDGKFENRTTGNMVWSEFVHLTARPVKGYPDPHLHAHCFVFNATWDEVEERWKAGEFGDLKASAPFFEAVFHARLARGLRSLGYEIDRGPKGWEVVGVPTTVIDKFSRRTAQIERLAEKKGVLTAKEKDKLGAATRENKRKGLTMADLRRHWDSQLTANEHAALGGLAGLRQSVRETPGEEGVEKAVDYALAHAFERASAVSKKKLLELVLRRSLDKASVARIKVELDRRIRSGEVLSRLVDGVALCTTRQVLLEEKAMLAYARGGRGACRPLVKEGVSLLTSKLTPEQKLAVQAVLASRDRVTVLKGRAGVGKTTLMRETVAAIQADGKKVFAFAPSAEASRGILRSEGFEKADTVAKLLLSPETQKAVKGQVIWIDEAGMLGSGTMRKVFELAKSKGARVILSGDSRQHGSVERGDALRLLEQFADLSSPEVKTIKRQRGAYREAIAALSDGRTVEGFDRLAKLGAIVEGYGDERARKLVADYLAAVEERKGVLVVSPTHREGDRITELLREGLRAQGKIGPAGEEREVASQKSLGWTEAERGDPRKYSPGLVLQFQQNAKGFKKGERLRVERGEEGLLARRQDGEALPLPVKLAGKFEVYEEKALALAPGDQLRFTCNGLSQCGKHRIHNGSVQSLKGFTEEGDLLLGNGWTVSKDYGHLRHGYVATSYASQGKTVDRVLVAQSSESFGASNQQQFYVSASRGRESVTIYTDSKEDLLRAVKRCGQRLSATELLQKGDPPPEPTYEKQATLVSRLLLQKQALASRLGEKAQRREAAKAAMRNAARAEVLQVVKPPALETAPPHNPAPEVVKTSVTPPPPQFQGPPKRDLIAIYGRKVPPAPSKGPRDVGKPPARPDLIEKYGRKPAPTNDPRKEIIRRARERGL